MCYSVNFDGVKFKKFTLPMDEPENNVAKATWYYLNVLDFASCIEGCISWEDYTLLFEVVESSVESVVTFHPMRVEVSR
jgi:hypothetical protein